MVFSNALKMLFNDLYVVPKEIPAHISDEIAIPIPGKTIGRVVFRNSSTELVATYFVQYSVIKLANEADNAFEIVTMPSFRIIFPKLGVKLRMPVRSLFSSMTSLFKSA